MDTTTFNALIGKTVTEIVTDNEYIITFKLAGGETWKMYHSQDCCEHVYIESIVGDLEDLKDSPLLQAEVVSNGDGPALSEYTDCYEWTFYKFATIKGSVTIRWYGESNGYYSTSVNFRELR